MAGSSIGNLAVQITGNAAPLIGALDQAARGVGQFGARIGSGNNFGNQINISMKQAGEKGGGAFLGGFVGAITGMAAGGIGSVVGSVGSAVTGFVVEAFKGGREVENLGLAFKALTGSAEGSARLLADLRKLSADSGYELTELGKSARTLAGNGVDAENVAPLLRAITEVSAGIGADGEQLGRFALAVAQVTAKGRFMAQELNQLSEAGLGVSEIAKTAGMSVGEFRSRVEAGHVSASVLYQTLVRLTSAGGRFNNFLGERAGSGVGQIAAVEAQWSQFKAVVGQGLISGLAGSGVLGAVRDLIGRLNDAGPQIKAGLDMAGDALREFAIEAARTAGKAADTWADSGTKFIDEFAKPILNGLAMMEAGLRQMGREVERSAPGLSTRLLRMTPFLSPLMGVVQGLRALPDVRQTTDPDLTGSVFARWMTDLDKFKIGMKEGGGYAEKWASDVSSALAPGVGAFGRLVDVLTKANDQMGKLKIPATLSGEVQEFAQKLNKQLAEGTTPFDKFGRHRQMLDEALFFDKGITLPMQSFKFGLAETFLDLEKSLTKFTTEFPRAMEAGTVDAASAVNRARYGEQAGSVQDRILKVLEAAKQNSDENKRTVETIADQLMRMNLRALGL